MYNLFLDKNIIFHYYRWKYFSEKTFESIIGVMEKISDGSCEAEISENSIFGLANHSIYKMQRKKEQGGLNLPDKEAEKKTRQNLAELFEGNWSVSHLEFTDFKKLIEDYRTHFEDMYQYYCFKKSRCDFFVTLNTRDFTFEPKVISPLSLINKMGRK